MFEGNEWSKNRLHHGQVFQVLWSGVKKAVLLAGFRDQVQSFSRELTPRGRETSGIREIEVGRIAYGITGLDDHRERAAPRIPLMSRMQRLSSSRATRRS
ncbi:hypothetical protein BHE74_00021119 [Ensete ventricosum]|nr:hypothetical protein GW17_00040892 [Ensete ventricosum]RWW71161.1 hypothetical protein BHE74_00021119 [Ensete ventricosum]RZS08078.1 hypothetical protein BHM03_00039003 [Ensete ventricosum]